MNTKHDNDPDIGYDLEITKSAQRSSAPGTWVSGRISGHHFEALVFPEPAEEPNFELPGSRISKLWIRRLADKRTVCNFDRGWDVRPTDATAAAIVDFLAAGLAQHIYGK